MNPENNVSPESPAPVAETTSNTPAPQPPESTPTPDKRKKYVLLGIGGFILAAIIAAVVVYFVNFNISKQDYQNAASAAQPVSTQSAEAVSAMDAIVNSKDTDPKKLLEKIDTAETKLASLKTANEELQGKKALNAGDIRDLNATFKKDYESFYDYSTTYTSSAKIAYGATSGCADVFKEKSPSTNTDFSKYKEANSDCRAKLTKAAGEIKDEDLKKVLVSYSTYLNDTLPITESIYKNMKTFNLDDFAKVQKDLQPFTKAYGDSLKSATENLQKRYKELGDMQGSLKTLTEAIDKKANA